MPLDLGFEWACFISYRYGDDELTQSFMKELHRALKSYINANFVGKLNIYWDENRIRGGDLIDQELAINLCKSVCMIVVFTPFYFDKDHKYCSREYKAMELLEQQRSKAVGEKLGLIIPIVFRGIPPKRMKSRKFYDFSKYSLVEPEIIKNPLFIEDINEIAQRILEIYGLFARKKIDFCKNCDSFVLPKENDDRVNALITEFKPVFPRVTTK